MSDKLAQQIETWDKKYKSHRSEFLRDGKISPDEARVLKSLETKLKELRKLSANRNSARNATGSRPASLSVRVVDQKGAPIPGVSVYLPSGNFKQTTNGSGYAQFDSLIGETNTHVQLAFSGFGYSGSISATHVVYLEPDTTVAETFTCAILPLQKGALFVEVRDSLGEPVFDAAVQIGHTTSKTNTKGVASLGNQEAGLGAVQVSVLFDKKISETHPVRIEADKTNVAKIKLAAQSNRMMDNLEDDNFWSELEQEIARRVGLWITGQWGTAIEKMSDFLDTKKGDSDATVAWNLTKGILGKIPGADIPMLIISTGIEISKLLPGQPSSAANFLSAARDAVRTVSKTLENRSHPAIVHVRKLKNDPKAGAADFRARIAKAARIEIQNLPSHAAVLRAMATDWTAAAKDTDTFLSPDYEGAQAGYIYCVMSYNAKTKKLTSRNPTLDDVERPGILDALKEGYGAGSSITAVELPTKGILTYYTDTPKQDEKEGYVRFIMEGAGTPGSFKVQTKSRNHLPLFVSDSKLPTDAEAIKLYSARYKTFKVQDLQLE